MRKETIPEVPGAKAGHLLFLSGMASYGENTKVQIITCLDNINDLLVKAGTSLDNVVDVVVYLTDISDRERYLNDQWKRYFPKNPPARTCVQAELGEGIYVEIKVVAVVPEA